MTKTQFIAAVQAKKGFHSIISDALAPDNIPGDPIEKRFLYVNHENADGTMGKTYVYYTYDTIGDVASFYNKETEVLDVREPSSDQKKMNALSNYLKQKYAGYFINRYDLVQEIAEADVYSPADGSLVKKTILVFKKNNTINDLDIV